MGIRMELFIRMNMAKRPVLIALADQIVERTWRVGGGGGATIA